MKKYLTQISLSLFCLFAAQSIALAYTQCNKGPPSQVWTNKNGGNWMCFGPGKGGCIFWGPGSAPNSHKKFYAQALLALAAGRPVIVRYPEDNGSCTSPSNRGDFQGFWIRQ